MREAVRDYSKGIGYFADFDGVVTYPTEWWQNIKSKQPGIEGLRKLDILVHGIVPHVADIERIFSLFGYQHTKSRNNMSNSTLKKSVEFEKVEGRGDFHKKNSAVKRDSGANHQRDIDMAEDENADNNEDNDGVAASEGDETFCMLAELEQGSSMEDKHQGGLCLSSSGLVATRRSDVERVAEETMLEPWLSIISEEDESKSSQAVLASNGAASSSTWNHRKSGHILFGWRLALARTTKIGDLFDLNSTVLMAFLTAKTTAKSQSTQNKNALQKSASESRKDADDERIK
uniref:AlNc14C167G7907 protein n=1 Tax=Albugo laibachii Nc14 TaxID=890382 RepID=F0WN74_9STRA|nr:AlNc14C167G7907 [Albugo laibachii Nc14]|eukprot:CCA22763.1 AlNc14C167G7907 [Albugo laibachii Nc14]